MIDFFLTDNGGRNFLMIIALIATLWVIIRKFVRNKILFTLVIAYVVFGFVCAFIFYVLANNMWYAYSQKEISIEPLLYLSLLFVVMCIPFCFFKLNSIQKIDDRYIIKYLKWIAIIAFCSSIFPFFESLIRIFTMSGQGLVNAYEGNDGAGFSLISFFSIRTRNYLHFFITPLLFYFFYKNNMKYSCFMLFSFATSLMIDFVSGGRGLLVNDLNYLVFFYAVFRVLLKLELRAKAKRIVLIGFLVVILFLSFITIARFTDGGNVVSADRRLDLLTWVFLYPGSGPCEFSRQMYSSTVRTDGDNSFAFIKTTLGLKTFKENNKRREYWEGKQSIQNYIFYTVIGDIYSDLGWINTIIIFIILAIIMSIYISRSTSGGSVSVQSLVLVSIYFEWLTMGIMANCYKEYYAQFFIFVTCLICLFFTIKQKGKNFL